jgi:hypothetical protein
MPCPLGARAKFSTARVRLRLKPGHRDTKRLLAKYRDRLICVRYRYDAESEEAIQDRGASRRRAGLGTAQASHRRL